MAVNILPDRSAGRLSYSLFEIAKWNVKGEYNLWSSSGAVSGLRITATASAGWRVVSVGAGLRTRYDNSKDDGPVEGTFSVSSTAGSKSKTYTASFYTGAGNPTRQSVVEDFVVGSINTYPEQKASEDGGEEDYTENYVSTIENVWARFERIPYEILASASVSPGEAVAAGCSASASPSSQTGYLGESASVTYAASPAPGWEFVSWSDGSKDAVHSVSYVFGPAAVKHVSLTALFKLARGVTVVCSPENAAKELTGTGEYDKGESCTISAKAKCSPWFFRFWDIRGYDENGEEVFKTEVTQDDEEYEFTIVYASYVCTAYYGHTGSADLFFDEGTGKVLTSKSGGVLCDLREIPASD